MRFDFDSMRRALGLGAALAALSVAACGDDNGDGDKGKVPDVSADPDEFPHFRFSDLEIPFEDAELCKAYIAEHSGATDRTDCLCDSCLEVMQECEVLPGCVEIRQCAEMSGCNSDITCYLAPGAPCTEVIDQWGNASLATTVSLDVLNCTKTHKCP
jgi:hypothetical protein